MTEDAATQEDRGRAPGGPSGDRGDRGDRNETLQRAAGRSGFARAALTGAAALLRRFAGVREVGILLVILAVSGLLSARTGAFLTASNLSAVAIGLVSDAVIAIGMTMVLIAGGFDLSVGSVLALCGMIAAKSLHAGVGFVPAIIIVLAAACAVGLVNGLVITKIGVSPLIATLAMMGIASSLTLIISGGYPVSRLPKSFLFLGQGDVLSVPFCVILMLAMVATADILLRRAYWLRLIYYVGGNERAAALSGIPVGGVRVAVYVFCGFMAGVAGILATSRLGSAFPLAGKGTELRVISACVIGGCTLGGGEGTVLGSMLGVLLMAVISNGLVLLEVNVYWQGIVSGLILIGAVTFDTLNRRRRA